MKKKNQNNEFNRIQRFSIRKYSFGAASVAIATYLMFMGNGAVYAAQEGVAEGTEPKAGAVVTPKEEPKQEAPKAESLDKSKLIGLIAEIETKLSDGKYDNKTEDSLSLLKSAVESAKSTVVNATSQEELNKAYRSLATTVSSKLKSKPKEKKEAPKVDTTNGKETVGKKAENTEPKAGTNSIENTGSHDSRNGKALDKDNAFRTDATSGHAEFEKTVGDITYSVEFSNDTTKEIYVYNKEEANVEFKIKSATNKVSYVETTKGSSQKFREVDSTTLTDDYGYYFKKITTDTDTPLTVAMTGQPNAGIMANANYTKTEDQNFAMGDRYLRVTAKDGTAMSAPNSGVNADGYFKIVLKSQTYKYQPKNLTNADKVLVANPNQLTTTELESVKNSLKVIYSTTSTDARLEKLKGSDVAETYSVVDTIVEEGKNFVVTYKDGSKDTVSKGLLVKSGEAPAVDTNPKAKGTVLSTDEKLSGTGVVGATVKVTVRNPEKTEVLLEKTATVNAEGKWEIPLTEGLNSNEALLGAS